MRIDPRIAENDSPVIPVVDTPIVRKKVVLAGNPNVGKSLFFNELSSAYVDVSNFPGTTVSVSQAVYKDVEIFDTPGIYGVSSYNDEERVARDIILQADIILNVVNSLHLERDLFFTQQLIDLGKKVTVFLNFSDELRKRNIVIEVKKLSQLLGVPVYEAAAVSGMGFDKLDEAIACAREGNHTPGISPIVNKFISTDRAYAHAVLIAEGDPIISALNGTQSGSVDDREFIYLSRRNYINEAAAKTEYENTTQGRLFSSIGMWALHPLTGFPMLAVILVIMYFLIGDLVSQRLVNFTEKKIGKAYVEVGVKKFVSRYAAVQVRFKDDPVYAPFDFPNATVPEPEKLRAVETYIDRTGNLPEFYFYNPLVRLLFGEFGIITMTVTYLIFLLLPLVLAFYFSMAFLEDSGYLPRLATMMDRALSKIGLNGKAIIPILLGFGCVTMATITTRILGTNRERTIATAILQFVIPCSAQLAVITFLMSSAGIGPLLIYISVIVTVLIVISTILNRSLPGFSSPLLLDLPMMNMPKLSNVCKKTYYRSIGFLQEAAVWFFIGALFIGLLEVTGILVFCQKALAPLTVYWLKLPGEAATAFIMGLVRRDFGTAGLFELALSPMQKTVAIITITLFVPCIASAMVMLKERGWREGMLIWTGTWIGAFAIGGLVAQIVIH